MPDLRERVARQVSPQAFIWGATPAQQAWAYEAADAILALVQADEAAIRADERAKTEADRDLFTPKGLIEVIRRIRIEAAYGQTNEFVFALDVFASRMQAWVEKRERYFSDKEPTDG